MNATRNRISHLLPNGFSRGFDQFVEQFFDGHQRPAWFAPAAAWEADDRYHVEVDFPGVSNDQIEITFDQGTLAIAAERKLPEGDRKGLHDERGYGRVTRTVALPDAADANSIEAEFVSGVLHVTIRKKPEAQPKRIDVKTS